MSYRPKPRHTKFIVWAIALMVLIIKPLNSSAAEIIYCSEILAGSSFRLITPGSLNTKAKLYFEGTYTERLAHAEKMENFGRSAAIKILEKYATGIPNSLPILEIGPFLRPIGNTMVPNNPWLVWEYDMDAAQRIANTCQAQVFALDLNKLKANDWESFINANKKSLNIENSESLNLGAAILSSVINYIDYPIVIKKVIDNMADGGILIIGNTNAGDFQMMNGRIPPNSSQLLEYLITQFPDQIEILPDTRIRAKGFGGNTTTFTAAIRVYKILPEEKRLDLYAQGVEIYTNFESGPYQLNFPDSATTPYWKYRDIWFDTHPATVAKYLDEVRKNNGQGQWGDYPQNRLAEIAYTWERIAKIREQVINAPADSMEEMLLRKKLEEPQREMFLPERYILLKALKIKKELRREFINERLQKLNERLHHHE